MDESLPQDERMQLAIAAVQSGQLKSLRRAAITYGVPRTTLQYRIKGRALMDAAQVNNRRLMPTEEAALVSWILSLDDCGLSPIILLLLLRRWARQARQLARGTSNN